MEKIGTAVYGFKVDDDEYERTFNALAHHKRNCPQCVWFGDLCFERETLIDEFMQARTARRGSMLNGAHVIRRGTTIFVPLPESMWKRLGTCACVYCSKDGNKHPASWDTLAVATDAPKKGGDYTWLVHAPEFHGAKKKREA